MLKIAFICLVLVYEAYGLDGVAKRSLDLSRKLKKKSCFGIVRNYFCLTGESHSPVGSLTPWRSRNEHLDLSEDTDGDRLRLLFNSKAPSVRVRHRCGADARVQPSALSQYKAPELGSQWRRDREVFQLLVRLETGGGLCGDLVNKFHVDVAEVNRNQRESHQRHRIVIGCLCERKIDLVEQCDEF